jgi:hypothetical protein
VVLEVRVGNMINEILTALGVVSVPTGAGIKGFLNLRDRVQTLEAMAEADGSILKSKHEVVLVKLDAIAEKIDFRCDAIENRVDRIERKVLNGDYHK